jgi:hypothetical protein
MQFAVVDLEKLATALPSTDTPANRDHEGIAK